MSTIDQVESILLANFPHHDNVADCLAELGTPSLFIAILDQGVLSTKCYSTVGDDTVTAFQACSISKAVNAVATMRLIDEGRLALDNTVGELLPDEYLAILVNTSPPGHRPLIKSITIRQLLSHTSGLSPPDFPGYARAAARVPTMAQLIAGANPANTPGFRLTSFPGYKYEYSGAGSTLLQLILEGVAGTDYPTAMKRLVLEPLGMTRSFYNSRHGDDGRNKTANPHWNGYTECPLGHHYFPELAAAGLWTTPTDLMKLIANVQKSLAGTGGGGGLLRQDTAKEMITEVEGEMALGWQIFGGDAASFGHSGSNDPGYRCLAVGFTAQGGGLNAHHANSGVAFMSNSAAGWYAGSQVLQTICTLQGWPMPGNQGRTPPLGRPAAESGEDWKEWKDEWKDAKGHSYLLKESRDGLPAVMYNSLAEIGLLPQMPSRRRDGGGGGGGFTDFIFQGMPLMSIQLEESDGNKTITLARLGSEPEKLKRG